MNLINQPLNGQLGNHLIELLDSEKYHTLNILVAFAKNSGVLRIINSLEKFRKKGGIVNVYVGVDLGGTSYEALTALLLHTNSLNIVHSEKFQTFHSKIYQFLGDANGLIIVGSNNLTGGGLWTNFESSILIPLDGSSDNDAKILKEMSSYIKGLTSLKNSFMPINTQKSIDDLLQNGYILKEVAEQVRLSKATTTKETHERLFGNGAQAKLPRLTTPKIEQTAAISKSPTLPTTAILVNEGETVWFETGKMTGGSRNILDLSKKSLLVRGNPIGTRFDLGDPNFIHGGVWFFDIDPTETDKTKSFILNFEGVNYLGNEIIYPTGNNANGTWRLQIKGISSDKKKITKAFRDKNMGQYLVKKVITFTKVEDNYYFMSVYPESELENFKSASYLLARNGSGQSAKMLGLLKSN
ncbi:MAG: hypothetical protein KU37_11755 [Sulfuricurvum sp. PC08-66]|nr:MAG: hypothetical protein KU37_11755 [Sulfuricurvum sp. PC08-66]